MTGPFSVRAGECSPPVEIEAFDAAGNPVIPSQPVGVLLSGGSGVAFFANGSCAGPSIESQTIQGSPRTSFSFVSFVVGSHDVVASAGALGTVVQTELVDPALPAVLRLSDAQVVAAGACSGDVTVRLEDDFGNPAPAPADVNISVASDDPAADFHATGCSAPLSQPLLVRPGETSASFAFRARRGGAMFLTASAASLEPGSQAFGIIDAVRAGRCTLPGFARSVDCSIARPVTLSRTVLFFEAVGSQATPGDAIVTCELRSTNAVSCERAGTAGPIEITWRVIEFPPESGVNVQRAAAPCDGQSSVELVLAQPVVMQHTFVLLSQYAQGTDVGPNDFKIAKLTSPTTVSVESITVCAPVGRVAVQVVEMPGANVVRGSVTLGQNTAAKFSPALVPADLSRTLVFASWRSAPTSTRICDRMVRAFADTATTIRFSRGLGSPQCDDAAISDIVYERIELPPGNVVRAVQASMADGQLTSAHALVDSVDVTRTVAVASGQGLSGTSGGEGDYVPDDVPGAFSANFSLTGDEVTLERGVNSGSALWSVSVIEFGL